MATQKFANHPELVANWPVYTKIADFEDGSKDRVLKYLVPHRSETDGTMEGKAAFLDRQRRLYHVNGCDIYLTIHLGHMSQPIEISGTEEGSLALIKDDVTGFGKNYLQAAREILRLYLRDGRVGCLVDGPKTTAPSVGQARANGERSYQIIYPAKRIRSWRRFAQGPKKGKLQELVLEDEPVEREGKCYESFRRFVIQETGPFQYQVLRGLRERRDEPIIDEKERTFVVEEAGTGALDFIPFFILGSGPEDSFLSDIWPLDMAIMNLNSVRSSVNFHHGYPRNIMTGVKKEEVSKMAEWTITLLADPTARVFTIDPGDPVSIERELAELRRQRDQRGLLRLNQLSEDTRQVQSADAKAFDLLQQKVFYDQTLDDLTRLLQEVWRTHAQMEGVKPDAINVKIARDYGLEDPEATERELAAAEATASRIGASEFEKEIAKIRASKLRFIPNEKEDEEQVRKRVYESIAAADAAASRAGSLFAEAGGKLFAGKQAEEGEPEEEPADDAPAKRAG